jgi:Zn-finger nucleic acid-binding protein
LSDCVGRTIEHTDYQITQLPDYPIEMNVVVRCPKCDAGLPVSAREAPAAIKCGRCASQIPLEFSDAVRADTAVDACPVCRGGDFYTR